MTGHDDSRRTSRSLPLTEPLASASAAGIVSESDIRRLVDLFYEAALADAMLGPIFDRHVSDWSAHLPKMYDFWSTVVLRTGRYAGRPIEAHQRIPGLTRAHFDRWIALWRETVERTIDAAGQEAFITAAERMAASMGARVIEHE